MGIDHVAFGPDTMFGDHVGLHHLHPLDRPEPDYPRSPYVDGIENPGEAFHRIAAWLSAHGYPEHEMAQVLGGNVLRVMRAAGLGGCAYREPAPAAPTGRRRPGCPTTRTSSRETRPAPRRRPRARGQTP